MKFNLYDITKPCPSQNPFCYDWAYIDNFFQTKSVKEAEGFSINKAWKDCSDKVYFN